MDLKQVNIKDYAIVPAAGDSPRSSMASTYADYAFSGEPTWKLSEDMKFDAAKKAKVPQSASRIKSSTPRSSTT